MSMIPVDTAQSLAKQTGMFTRIRHDRLVFYLGAEEYPNSWIAAGSTLIDNTNQTVSIHAVNLIIDKK